VVVILDLRPPVNLQCVFDGQVEQAECVTDLGQLTFFGLEQPQPDEAALVTPGGRLLQRHRARIAPAALLVVSTVNDHVREPGVSTHARSCFAAACAG
jgi:hypothetical protein